MTLLHLGGHSGGFFSPETLAVVFPAVLVLIALAIRPDTPVNRMAMACYRLLMRPMRGFRRG